MARKDVRHRYLWEKSTPEIKKELQKLIKEDITGRTLVTVMKWIEWDYPNMNMYWNFYNDDQLRELKKCILQCRSCHMKLHGGKHYDK